MSDDYTLKSELLAIQRDFNIVVERIEKGEYVDEIECVKEGDVTGDNRKDSGGKSSSEILRWSERFSSIKQIIESIVESEKCEDDVKTNLNHLKEAHDLLCMSYKTLAEENEKLKQELKKEKSNYKINIGLVRSERTMWRKKHEELLRLNERPKGDIKTIESKCDKFIDEIESELTEFSQVEVFDVLFERFIKGGRSKKETISMAAYDKLIDAGDKEIARLKKRYNKLSRQKEVLEKDVRSRKESDGVLYCKVHELVKDKKNLAEENEILKQEFKKEKRSRNKIELKNDSLKNDLGRWKREYDNLREVNVMFKQGLKVAKRQRDDLKAESKTVEPVYDILDDKSKEIHELESERNRWQHKHEMLFNKHNQLKIEVEMIKRQRDRLCNEIKSESKEYENAKFKRRMVEERVVTIEEAWAERDRWRDKYNQLVNKSNRKIEKLKKRRGDEDKGDEGDYGVVFYQKRITPSLPTVLVSGWSRLDCASFIYKRLCETDDDGKMTIEEMSVIENEDEFNNQECCIMSYLGDGSFSGLVTGSHDYCLRFYENHYSNLREDEIMTIEKSDRAL